MKGPATGTGDITEHWLCVRPGAVRYQTRPTGSKWPGRNWMDPRRSESTARALDGDTLSGMFLAGGPGVPPQHPTRPPFLDRAAHSRPHRLVLQRADPLPAYARLTEARSPAPSHCCFTTSLLPDCPKAGSSQWDRSGWQTGEDPHTCDPAVHGRQVLCLRYCCSDAPFTLGCC